MIPYTNSREVARRTLAALHELTGLTNNHEYLSAPNIGDRVKKLCGDNNLLERPPFGEQVHLSLSRYLADEEIGEGLVIYVHGMHHSPEDVGRRGRVYTRFYRTNPLKVDEIAEEIGDLEALFPKE